MLLLVTGPLGAMVKLWWLKRRLTFERLERFAHTLWVWWSGGCRMISSGNRLYSRVHHSGYIEEPNHQQLASPTSNQLAEEVKQQRMSTRYLKHKIILFYVWMTSLSQCLVFRLTLSFNVVIRRERKHKVMHKLEPGSPVQRHCFALNIKVMHWLLVGQQTLPIMFLCKIGDISTIWW